MPITRRLSDQIQKTDFLAEVNRARESLRNELLTRGFNVEDGFWNGIPRDVVEYWVPGKRKGFLRMTPPSKHLVHMFFSGQYRRIEFVVYDPQVEAVVEQVAASLPSFYHITISRNYR